MKERIRRHLVMRRAVQVAVSFLIVAVLAANALALLVPQIRGRQRVVTSTATEPVAQPPADLVEDFIFASPSPTPPPPPPAPEVPKPPAPRLSVECQDINWNRYGPTQSETGIERFTHPCWIQSINGFIGEVEFSCVPPDGMECTPERNSFVLGAGEKVEIRSKMQVGPGPEGDYKFWFTAQAGMVKDSWAVWAPIRDMSQCDPPCPNGNGRTPSQEELAN